MNVEINGYRGSIGSFGSQRGPDQRQVGEVQRPGESKNGNAAQPQDELAASEELKAELKRRQGVQAPTGVDKVEKTKEVDNVEATRKRDLQRLDQRDHKKRAETVRRQGDPQVERTKKSNSSAANASSAAGLPQNKLQMKMRDIKQTKGQQSALFSDRRPARPVSRVQYMAHLKDTWGGLNETE